MKQQTGELPRQSAVLVVNKRGIGNDAPEDPSLAVSTCLNAMNGKGNDEVAVGVDLAEPGANAMTLTEGLTS